jgi:hypothetical protein
MENKNKSTETKQNTQTERSQVLDTEGAIMPDPNRKTHASSAEEAGSAFSQKSQK